MRMRCHSLEEAAAGENAQLRVHQPPFTPQALLCMLD